jgi:hypothetical protein
MILETIDGCWSRFLRHRWAWAPSSGFAGRPAPRAPGPAPQRRRAGRLPRRPPLRCAHPRRRLLPAAGDAERPLPPAWRPQHRTQDGRGPRPLRRRPPHPRLLFGRGRRLAPRRRRLLPPHGRALRRPEGAPHRWAWGASFKFPDRQVRRARREVNHGAHRAESNPARAARNHPSSAPSVSSVLNPSSTAGHGLLPPKSERTPQAARPTRRPIPRPGLVQRTLLGSTALGLGLTVRPPVPAGDGVLPSFSRRAG